MPQSDAETLEIDRLQISTRAYNGLKHSGITTIKQIIHLGYDGLMLIPNMGKVSVRQVLDAVKRRVEQLSENKEIIPPTTWRDRNSITDREISQIGSLLCHYDARDLALMVVRLQGKVE